MAIEDLIKQYLSEAILPAAAIALAGGLVRGARALETDANKEALEYVSNVLTAGDLRTIGKAGASLIPFVFDKVFGPKPFSFRFIFRSVIATTLFWMILLALKHPDKNNIFNDITEQRSLYVVIIPLWYIVDWLSLWKAKFFMTAFSFTDKAIKDSANFLMMDIFGSFFLIVFAELFVHKTLRAFNLHNDPLEEWINQSIMHMYYYTPGI